MAGIFDFLGDGTGGSGLSDLASNPLFMMGAQMTANGGDRRNPVSLMQGVPQMLMLTQEGQRRQDEVKRKREHENKTLAFLEKNAPELAEFAAATGDNKAALNRYLQQRYSKPKDPYTVVGGHLYNKETDEWKSPPDKTGPDFDTEQKLRKEYSGLDLTKDFNKVEAAYGRISATEPTAAGDLALIFNFMKMLDPGSVVREGEFANAQNTAGVPDRVRNVYNRLMSGERLNPAQREAFSSQAETLYEESANRMKGVNERYRSISGSHGLDPSRIIRPVTDYNQTDPLGIR